MLRLQLAGPDTLATSSLCERCPHSPAGCCAAPPRVALADIGRIVMHGGRDWLIGEIAAGRLVPAPGNAWLVLPRRPHASGVLACVYLGPTGCTIPHDRRSATCNYYVCGDVLDRAGEDGSGARAAVDDLVDTYARWDAELATSVSAEWKDGHPFEASFLDWLGTAFRELMQESGTLTDTP